MELLLRLQLGGEKLVDYGAGFVDGLGATLPSRATYRICRPQVLGSGGRENSYRVLVAKSGIESTKTQ
jgi:hypothetical protein